MLAVLVRINCEKQRTINYILLRGSGTSPALAWRQLALIQLQLRHLRRPWRRRLSASPRAADRPGAAQQLRTRKVRLPLPSEGGAAHHDALARVRFEQSGPQQSSQQRRRSIGTAVLLERSGTRRGGTERRLDG